MILDNQRVVLLCAILLTVVLLGPVLYFYWTYQETWMVDVLISVTLLASATWLTVIWALKVVFPFLKTTVDGAATETGMTQSSVLRWIVGLGTPIMIMSLVLLSLLYFSTAWFGSLIFIVFIIFLLKALIDNSFFKKGDGSAT